MKNNFAILCILFATIILYSCKNEPKAITPDPKVSESKSSAGDITQFDALDHDFKITSEGSKLFLKGFFKQALINSAITVDNGKLHIQNGLITTGEFNLNMASIVMVAKRDEEMDKFLTSDKNFNTSKYPTGTIRINECIKAVNDQQATHVLKGDLILKEKSIPFNVRARVDYAPKFLSINSDQIIIKASEIGIKVADPSQENLYFTITINASIQ
jgi:hypothetical protein